MSIRQASVSGKKNTQHTEVKEEQKEHIFPLRLFLSQFVQLLILNCWQIFFAPFRLRRSHFWPVWNPWKCFQWNFSFLISCCSDSFHVGFNEFHSRFNTFLTKWFTISVNIVSFQNRLTSLRWRKWMTIGIRRGMTFLFKNGSSLCWP